MHQKNDLRKKIKTQLSEFTSDEWSQLSLETSNHLMMLIEELGFTGAKLGGFAPLQDELDWMISLSSSIKNNLAFPSITSDSEMVFKESLFEELRLDNSFGVKILEPRDDKRVVTPEVLILPGLCFGKDGSRLGRGKGYYDKYLTTYNGIKIGICLEELLMDGVPVEPHDISANYIVTDKRFFKVTK